VQVFGVDALQGEEMIWGPLQGVASEVALAAMKSGHLSGLGDSGGYVCRCPDFHWRAGGSNKGAYAFAF